MVRTSLAQSTLTRAGQAQVGQEAASALGANPAARSVPTLRCDTLTCADKSFRCPFCAHPGTISVKMDSVAKLGRLTCSNCDQGYESPITHLSEPVDVYTDWLGPFTLLSWRCADEM